MLEAENPGGAAHMERTASRRTPCWKHTDLKKGTTDNTMARLVRLAIILLTLTYMAFTVPSMVYIRSGLGGSVELIKRQQQELNENWRFFFGA